MNSILATRRMPVIPGLPKVIRSRLARTAPVHVVGSLRLGSLIDSEPDGQPDAVAGQGSSGGDDNNGEADEDGVELLASLVASAGSATLSSAEIHASEAGKLGRLDRL